MRCCLLLLAAAAAGMQAGACWGQEANGAAGGAASGAASGEASGAASGAAGGAASGAAGGEASGAASGESAAPWLVCIGHKSEFHLTGRTGTATYHWKGAPWLVRLQFDAKSSDSDRNYYYYDEVEFPGYRWAVGKYGPYHGPRHIFFRTPSGQWMHFDHADVVKPVNTGAQVPGGKR